MLVVVGCHRALPDYVPRDPQLRAQPLYFYPAEGVAKPKAGVFFLGNDLGFWQPHRNLARRLASRGYAVVGFDIRTFLSRLPDSSVLRDSVLATQLPVLVGRSLSELGASGVPVVIGGHSFGADLALWVEGHAPIPGTVGVLALGPTRRDHPRVTINDKVNLGEPTEPGSFATVDAIRDVPPKVRIALVRGASDKERKSDQAFIAAGGSRLSYTVVPLASHSLKSLVIAGPMIEHALDELVRARSAGAGGLAAARR
jgi:hypothetical protein